MSHFKVHRPVTLSRPLSKRVLQVQIGVTVLLTVVAVGFALNIGISVAIGGLISIAGQAFYNVRALRHFGSADATQVISATFSAMWGKWLIIIAGSLIAVIKIQDLKAGVLYASLFTVHTVGALLLPVLVKRAAK